VAPSGMGTATFLFGLASFTETKTRREASCARGVAIGIWLGVRKKNGWGTGR
jgi:hypothetical protein